MKHLFVASILTALVVFSAADLVRRIHANSKMRAALNGRGGGMDAAIACLDHGADVNITDDQEYNLLLYAVRTQKGDVVTRLLKAGIDVDQAPAGWITPLGEAIIVRDFQLVKRLLDYGADPNINNDYDHNCVLEIAMMTSQPEIEKILIEHGALLPPPERACD